MNIMWTVNGVAIPGTGTSITFDADEDVNEISVTFTNSDGCDQTVTITIPTVPPSYTIPNAFTPDNGDDVNDHFRVTIMGNIVLERLVVFNRWGQKVYESGLGDVDGWDGRFKNEPAASDTYVYTASLRYPDGRIVQEKGDVILLR